MMKWYKIKPIKELASYVRFFWIAEFDAPKQESVHHHLFIADSCFSLNFPYRTHSSNNQDAYGFFKNTVQGQSDQKGRYTAKGSFGMFGASLFPFVIPPLFSIPATELTNQCVDFETLLGSAGKDLNDKMNNASDNNARLIVLCKFLCEQLLLNQKDQGSMIVAIKHIIDRRGLGNVSELAGRYYLSQRQFERNFKVYSGFAPKLFSRIIRFESALDTFRAHKSLTKLSHSLGYYDQSHFIKDFNEFSGLSPHQYFSQEANFASEECILTKGSNIK